MKRVFSLTILSLSIITIGCSPKKATTTEASDSEKVAELKKTYNETQLKEGMAIWQDKCGNCHKLPKPEEYTVAKMERVLPRMIKRSKLDDTQAGNVRAYILTHAKL